MLRGVGFELRNIEWNYTPSPDAAHLRLPRSVHAIDARCNNCLREFHAEESAEEGPGRIRLRVGWLTIACPHCGQEETIVNPVPPEH